MEQMIPTRLSGSSETFVLEESAYRRLLAFLDEARLRIDEPDRDEVVGDLERAISEQFLAKQATGEPEIRISDVDRILEQIGPIEPTTETPVPPTPPLPPARRPLYRISDGQWFGGVCTGLAVRGDLDLDWVRSIFVILTVFTGGFLGLVYLVLMFTLPVVPTADAYRDLVAQQAG